MTPAVARRLAKPLTTACAIAACCLVATSCKTTKKQSPTVMDTREVVPSPYVQPQTKTVVAPSAVVSAPTARPRVTTPAPRATPTVQAPRIKSVAPAPAPAIVKEAPVVSPPPVVQPPPTATSKFKPTRIVKKTPTVKAPPATASNNITYVVKKGDTLWDIGRAYGVSVKEICQHASLDASKVLRIGQKIELPAGARYVPPSQRPTIKKTVAKPTPKRPKPAARPVAALVKHTGSTSAGKGKYIVQKGDNLWTIAKNHSMSVKEIMALNGLKNDRLMPGQVLVVDGSAAPAPQAGNTGTKPPTVVITTPAGAKPAPSQPDVVIDVNQGVIKNNAANAQTPPTGAIPAPTAAATTKNLPHFVVDGDSLANIAEMYGSKVEWITRENGNVGSDADLKPGLRINVPVEDIDR